MKKLLAILLTLIFAFSCFGTLGTTTMAEEAGENYKVIMQSDFHKARWASTDSTTSRWIGGTSTEAGQNTVEYLDDDANGVTDYAKITYAANSAVRNRFISSQMLLHPGREYELSFEMRIPATSDFVNDGSSISAPNMYIVKGHDVKKYENGVAINNIPSSFESAGYAYAYEAAGTTVRRETLPFVWQVGDYSPKTRVGYSSLSYQNLYQLVDSTKEAPKDLNDEFATWQKVTVKFVATASFENAGVEVVNFVFQVLQDGQEFHIRNFVAKEFCEERVIFESNVSKDGNMTAFEGSAKNQDSDFITFPEEQTEGEKDYIELKSQASKKEVDEEGKEKTVKMTPSVITEPFYVVPGNDYEISYDLRIPEESATYILSGYSTVPEWRIFEVNSTKYYQRGYVANPQITEMYSYNNKNTPDANRRTTNKINYTYAFKETGETLVSKSDHVNSLVAYSTQDFKNIGTGNVTDIFDGKWVTITIKFTGLASDANSGAQLTALCLTHCPDGYVPNTVFQVKNVKVKEYAYGKTTPVYDQVHVEDFEFSTTQVADVAEFFNSSNNNRVLEWGVNSSKILEEDGNKFLSAFSRNNFTLLPLNKALFANYWKYDFSFDWKLKLNEGSTSNISSIYFVGYNYSTDEEYNVQTIKGYKVLATADLSNGGAATGEWENLTFKSMLTSKTNTYENYGILIRYNLQSEDDVYSAAEDSIYIDNFVVKESAIATIGDYDLDDVVDAVDIAILAKYFAGWNAKDTIYVDNALADVSGDGNANLFDLVKIAQDVAGWSK